MATRTYVYPRRIVGAVLPTDGVPILIPRYRVINVRDLEKQTNDNDAKRLLETFRKNGIGDYGISLYGIKNPFVLTDWPESGTITPKIAQLLGAQKNTRVMTNSDPEYCEGLRTLLWKFMSNIPHLYADNVPYRESGDTDSLLGSKTEGGLRLKILGTDYFIEPVKTPEGKHLLENQYHLYAETDGVVVLPSPALNSVARFIQQSKESPDQKWIREEMERLERNGHKLKEEQIIKLYKILRNRLLKSFIRASEILAWPSQLEGWTYK